MDSSHGDFDELGQHTPTTTIEDALEQVDLVLQLELPKNNNTFKTVSLQPALNACTYYANLDSKLCDRENFPSNANSGLFHHEAEARAKLVRHLGTWIYARVSPIK